jgi:hypothetical protein
LPTPNATVEGLVEVSLSKEGLQNEAERAERREGVHKGGDELNGVGAVASAKRQVTLKAAAGEGALADRDLGIDDGGGMHNAVALEVVTELVECAADAVAGADAEATARLLLLAGGGVFA